jgi:type II secretory pathway predicted ATPase ExeA
MVVVCHTSERHRFAEHRMAHLSTRISEVVEFKPASLEDCGLYLTQLCEVALDDAIIDLVHKQSRGRYRLMTSAINTLESIAKNVTKTNRLTVQDLKKQGFAEALCVDAMKDLNKKGASNGRG